MRERLLPKLLASSPAARITVFGTEISSLIHLTGLVTWAVMKKRLGHQKGGAG